MRAPPLALLLAAGAALAGCQESVTTGPATAPLAPGPDPRGARVDPSIVGDRLLAAGEPLLALDAYVEAVGVHGPSPELDRAMAAANLRLGRLGQAERQLRAVVAARPRDAGAWNDLGVVLMERGREGEAERTFRQAFALDPANVTIRDNLLLAGAALDRTRYEEAGTDAAILTRRRDGTFGLLGPDGHPRGAEQ